ncbi:MAG: CCC motif membrane protein [Bacteroidales bacterium]|nr:CCC motif membrane protein [Bacteroidales bacterium]
MEEKNVTKKTAPNSVAALVLGICSIVLGCGFFGLLVGLVGFVCGIVGLVLANKGLVQYNEDPSLYTDNKMLNAGKITSIIGIVFGAIAVILTLIYGVSIFAILGEM